MLKVFSPQWVLFPPSFYFSYIWGWLCDKIGRKRSLLISMTLMLVATMVFGFSKSFAWAVTARLFQGFFGGMYAFAFILPCNCIINVAWKILLSTYVISPSLVHESYAPFTLQGKPAHIEPGFWIRPSDWSIKQIQSFDWLNFKLV